MRDTKQDAPGSSGSAPDQPVPNAMITDPNASVSERLHSDVGEVDFEGESSARPVSADMQQFIGRQLRAVFDDVAKQPIPDRFLELMKQLDNKTGAR